MLRIARIGQFTDVSLFHCITGKWAVGHGLWAMGHGQLNRCVTALLRVYGAMLRFAMDPAMGNVPLCHESGGMLRLRSHGPCFR